MGNLIKLGASQNAELPNASALRIKSRFLGVVSFVRQSEKLTFGCFSATLSRFRAGPSFVYHSQVVP